MSDKAQILLVEDTITQAMMFQHLLEKNGLTTKLARDGDSALAAVAESSPALVLSDVNMPGISGYELSRRLKANPSYSRIKVVLLASAVERSEILDVLESGADGLLLKDMDEVMLVDCLKSFLNMPDDGRSGAGNEKLESSVFLDGESRAVSYCPDNALRLLVGVFDLLTRQRQL